MCLKELSMAFLVFPVFNSILSANSVNPDAYSWVNNSSIVFGWPLVRDEITGFLKALLITSKSVRTIARIIFNGNKPSDNKIFGRVPSHTAYTRFDLSLQIERMIDTGFTSTRFGDWPDRIGPRFSNLSWSWSGSVRNFNFHIRCDKGIAPVLLHHLKIFTSIRRESKNRNWWNRFFHKIFRKNQATNYQPDHSCKAIFKHLHRFSGETFYVL